MKKGQGGRFGLGLSIVSKVCKANHYIVKGENSEDGVRLSFIERCKKQRKEKRKRLGLKNERSKKHDERCDNWIWCYCRSYD